LRRFNTCWDVRRIHRETKDLIHEGIATSLSAILYLVIPSFETKDLIHEGIATMATPSQLRVKNNRETKDLIHEGIATFPHDFLLCPPAGW